MDGNFTVTYVDAVDKPNCVLVSNYHSDNEVANYFENYRTIKETITKEKAAGNWSGNDIGIWRIKSLK